MAKINVAYDTIEKTMVCEMDGKVIDNVIGVDLGQSYMDEDEFMCEIVTRETDETNKMYKFTKIIASENGKEVLITKPEDKNTLQDEILKFFVKKE